MRAVDLFAGAGGWDIAAHRLGWAVDRVEIWAPANATAALNGMTTVHEDVTTFRAGPGAYDVQIASPSCKTYSMAGGGAGRRALDLVLHGVQEYRHGRPMSWADCVRLVGDADAALTLEPLRVALECEPTYIAWEQTPAVLPVWEACADVLRERGYSAVTGVLNAEQYGVPQTRRRAVLMARRDGQGGRLPVPTHSRFHVRDPKRMDEGVKPWVSMAEALGWGMTERPSMTVCGGGTATGGAEPFGNAARQGIQRELEAGRWAYRAGAAPNSPVRELDQPAPTLAFGHNVARHQFVQGGTRERVHDSVAGYTQIIKIIPAEAACLQTFPADHRFVGNKGQVFQQIGNAVPPLLAEAILTTLTT